MLSCITARRREPTSGLAARSSFARRARPQSDIALPLTWQSRRSLVLVPAPRHTPARASHRARGDPSPAVPSPAVPSPRIPPPFRARARPPGGVTRALLARPDAARPRDDAPLGALSRGRETRRPARPAPPPRRAPSPPPPPRRARAHGRRRGGGRVRERGVPGRGLRPIVHRRAVGARARARVRDPVLARRRRGGGAGGGGAGGASPPPSPPPPAAVPTSRRLPARSPVSSTPVSSTPRSATVGFATSAPPPPPRSARTSG